MTPQPSKDRRFGLVLRWVREQARSSAAYVRRNEDADTLRWLVTKERGRADAFKAMVIVMEAETRKLRCQQRRKR